MLLLLLSLLKLSVIVIFAVSVAVALVRVVVAAAVVFVVSGMPEIAQWTQDGCSCAGWLEVLAERPAATAAALRWRRHGGIGVVVVLLVVVVPVLTPQT
jgi:hypothetical protein